MKLSLIKFEILKDGSITVMFQASKDQVRDVVSAWEAAQSGEKFCVEREQMQLPNMAVDRVCVLSDILLEIRRLDNRIEEELVRSTTVVSNNRAPLQSVEALT